MEYFNAICRNTFKDIKIDEEVSVKTSDFKTFFLKDLGISLEQLIENFSFEVDVASSLIGLLPSTYILKKYNDNYYLDRE